MSKRNFSAQSLAAHAPYSAHVNTQRNHAHVVLSNHPHPRFAHKRMAWAMAVALLAPTTYISAQAADTNMQLAPISVTANPLGVGSDEMVTPVSVLNGRELSLRRESTLGETLNSIPGVSSSYFGPNASRPIIRGLDSERVRIMQNGIGILDASSLSFDHAVAIDPLIIEQIDVVRGPAALLYGGSAMGGVVNAIDHRIPTESINGITGRSEVRFGGADTQRNGAVVVDAGNGVLTVHADAYGRKTNDLDIPGYARTDALRAASPDPDVDKRGRLVNSASSANGGALGASIQFEKGYAGVSASTFNNNYGTVAEPTVKIDQASDRYDFASEFKGLEGIIQRVKVRAAYTDYMHQEIESGVVGTTFKNRGTEGSVEVGHAPIGIMNGVLGMQFQDSTFQALGEEAFVPKNSTTSQAGYVYEELPLDPLKITFGTRLEHANVDSDGGGKFGAAQQRSFDPKSASIGGLLTLTEQWSLASNLSHNERAPSYFELYANGPHIASGQIEVGNSALNVERANGVDVQLRWKQNQHSFNVSTYYTRFNNFISLQNDPSLDDAAENLKGARFVAVPAVFKGIEGEGKFRVYDDVGTVDLSLRGDYVRATNADTGEPLPRIAPLKLGFGVNYAWNRFGSRLDVLHAFKQDRTAANETSTDGYTQVNAMVTYVIPASVHVEAFVKAYNLLNEDMREHTSILKDIAPLPGRSILMGLRTDF